MEKPSVSKSLLQAIRSIRDDVFLVWNDVMERFQVIHVDKKTKTKRILLTAENEIDGSYQEPDMRLIVKLQGIDFDMLDCYPNPNDLVGEMLKRHDLKKMKQKQYAEEYRKWWNKDMKTFWRKALENAQRGIFSAPEEQKRKIIIT